MKIRKDFVLHQMGDSWVVVGVGESALHFQGMIYLNETGVFLWKCLEKESDRQELVQALCGEYRVEKAEAEQDVDAFCEKLRSHGVLEE